MNNKVWIPAFAGMTAIVLVLLFIASPALAGDVAVIGYNSHRTSTGKYLRIKGTVKNDTGSAVNHVKVTAICNTWSEEFVDAGSADTHPKALEPDEQGAFSIRIPYNSEIDRDNIKFKVEYKDAE